MLPFVISPDMNLAHIIEMPFLAHGFAEQLRGRHDRALAMCVVAALSKPALGYIYGLLLICFIIKNTTVARPGLRSPLRQMIPAAATCLSLTAVFTLVFRLRSVLITALPISGFANYRASGFGFVFGPGRVFLGPPDVKWHYYMGTVVGFWILGSCWLTLSGVFAMSRMARGKANNVELPL